MIVILYKYCDSVAILLSKIKLCQIAKRDRSFLFLNYYCYYFRHHQHHHHNRHATIKSCEAHQAWKRLINGEIIAQLAFCTQCNNILMTLSRCVIHLIWSAVR